MSENKLSQNPSLNFNELLKASIRLPVVKIDRDTFLRTELEKRYDDETICRAIEYNPAYANIPAAEIDLLAAESIKAETLRVSAISFAAGLPGGFALIGTIPADLTQYFGHMLRIMQKLVYLYGWHSLLDKNGELDSETTGLVTLFTGVMFGVNGANSAIAKIAVSAAKSIEKRVAAKALTKGTIYPIVKRVTASLGIKMTKTLFAKSVSKAVPVIGGITSGAITYATFRPMSEKLRKYLASLPLASTSFYSSNEQLLSKDEDASGSML